MTKEDNLQNHLTSLLNTYKNNISDFDDPYKEDAMYFEKGLWMAIATLFLFVAAAGKTVLASIFSLGYHPLYDFLVVLIIGVLLMYGKDG